MEEEEKQAHLKRKFRFLENVERGGDKYTVEAWF